MGCVPEMSPRNFGRAMEFELRAPLRFVNVIFGSWYLDMWHINVSFKYINNTVDRIILSVQAHFCLKGFMN